MSIDSSGFALEILPPSPDQEVGHSRAVPDMGVSVEFIPESHEKLEELWAEIYPNRDLTQRRSFKPGDHTIG